jgi:endonuclease/exonuclease/phosphatase family metal-dependent hydrolase
VISTPSGASTRWRSSWRPPVCAAPILTGCRPYPARRPRIELDFILYSRGIEIDSFEIPDVTYSDHRPLICDFRVKGTERAAA